MRIAIVEDEKIWQQLIYDVVIQYFDGYRIAENEWI